MNSLTKNQASQNANTIGVSRSLKSVLVMLAIVFSSTLFANNTNPVKSDKPVTISETLGKFLKNPNLVLDEDVNVLINFYVNEHSEIVVLSVKTDDSIVEDYIKSRLNYKKVNNADVSQRKFYKLPLKIKKS